MANNIALAKTFVLILDEIYKLASLTSKLDGAAELARQGANANELIVPMLSMQGLGDYSRNDGYVKGDVTMTNETIKCNYDRGRKFYVDALDNEETAKLAFSRLSGEFIRTKVCRNWTLSASHPTRARAVFQKPPQPICRTAHRCWRRCVWPSRRWTKMRCPRKTATCSSRRRWTA